MKRLLKKYLRRMIIIWDLGLAAVGHLRRMRGFVRAIRPGADPVRSSDREAVYVHFDRAGEVHDYVHEQVRALVDAGFRVTFVSNAPHLSETTLATILPLCRQVVWRRNVGYDFGAYKDGIAALGNLGSVDRLVLMNDSAYGPFFPLPEVLAQVDPSKVDIWGITDSWQHGFHIQSYFLMFLRGSLGNPTFRKFWQRFPYVNDKFWVIRNGEIKLTQAMTRRKLRAAVLAPYWTVAATVLKRLEGSAIEGLPPAHKNYLTTLHANLVMGVPLNQTHYFWDTLIAEFGCPFLKREVIVSNPEQQPNYWRWPEVIAHKSRYDLDLIRRHLQAQ